MAKKRTKTSKQILTSVISGRKALVDPKIVVKKNRRDLSKVKPTGNKPMMEKEVYDTIDWMREGKSHEWCTEQLRNTINPNTGRLYAPRFVENIITAANQLINLWYKSHIYKVEKLHVSRYNKIIIDKLNKKYSFNEGMPEWLMIKIQGDDLLEVLQAMKQKEMLVGMHRKSFKLTINTQNNINITSNKPKPKAAEKIDIEKLTLNEQVELLQLIALSSRDEDEMFGVKLREKSADNIEDAVVEEIVNNNIKDIEPFSIPIQDNQGSTLLDIRDKIQQRLLQAATKKR